MITLEEKKTLLKEARMAKNEPSLVAPVEFISLLDIEPDDCTRWVVRNLIPKGELTVIAGVPGSGKTNLSLWLAAQVSRPDGQFNGKPVDHGKVLIWSGEDRKERLASRLYAFGADPDNVTIIGKKTMTLDGKIVPFNMSEDIVAIQNSIVGREDGGKYRLLIIDPIVSAISGDMNQANNVRAYLEPLVELAENQNMAVVGITHFSKGSGKSSPMDRILGSQAFNALARMSLGVIKDDQSNIRRLVILKTNLARDDVGYEFSLEYEGNTPVIELLGELEGSARELIAEIEPQETDGSELSEAMEFLRGILHDGPIPVSQVKVDADGAGYSWATIRRASQKLKIDKRKDLGAKGIFRWAMPS